MTYFPYDSLNTSSATIHQKSYWRVKNTTASPYFTQNGNDYNREDFLSDTFIDTNETNYTSSFINYDDGVIEILQDGLYDVSFSCSFEGSHGDTIKRANVKILKTTDGTTPSTTSDQLLHMSTHVGWNAPYEVLSQLLMSGRDLVNLTQGTKLRVFLQVTLSDNQPNSIFKARLLANSTTFIGIKVD